jgi:hypothetical protein
VQTYNGDDPLMAAPYEMYIINDKAPTPCFANSGAKVKIRLANSDHYYGVTNGKTFTLDQVCLRMANH